MKQLVLIRIDEALWHQGHSRDVKVSRKKYRNGHHSHKNLAAIFCSWIYLKGMEGTPEIILDLQFFELWLFDFVVVFVCQSVGFFFFTSQLCLPALDSSMNKKEKRKCAEFSVTISVTQGLLIISIRIKFEWLCSNHRSLVLQSHYRTYKKKIWVIYTGITLRILPSLFR